MTDKKKGHPTAGLVALVIILIMIYIHSIASDHKNAFVVKSLKCEKKPRVVVYDYEKCKIEQVLNEYKIRRNANKSRTKRLQIPIQ